MIKDNFIQLLRHVICNNSPYDLPAGEDLAALYALAKKQDLAHLLGIPFRENGQQVTGAVLKEELMAIWRYEQQNLILTQIREALEEARIYFIPLKGVVLRKWYPEPWMRTSADIDILVQKEDLDKVSVLFSERLGFHQEKVYSNEISFRTQNAVHIELHHVLIEKEYDPDIASVLKNVWNESKVVENMGYELEMPDEMLYFYHVAHMMKHFSYAGGCGIRPFLDLWLLDNVVPGDASKRNFMLERGKIITFANAVQNLAEMWFSAKPYPNMEKVEEFVLNGGLYGTKQRKTLIRKKSSGSRFEYYVKRIFPPLSIMKINYPVLNKYKWVVVFCWGHRLIKVLRPNNRRRLLQEFRYDRSLNSVELENIESIFREIGVPF